MSYDRSYITPTMIGVTQNKITRDLRSVDIDLKKFEHLKNIKFTDTPPEITESWPSTHFYLKIWIKLEMICNFVKRVEESELTIRFTEQWRPVSLNLPN